MERYYEEVKTSGDTSLLERANRALEEVKRARAGEDDAAQNASEAS